MAEGVLPAEMNGIVKWFDPGKGYGFIQGNGDKDIFLHVKELRRVGIIALNDGDKVSFLANKGPKGLFATQVKVLPGKTS